MHLMVKMLAVLLLVVASPVVAEDVPGAAEASPDVYKVEVDNEKVSILRMTLKPGQIDNLHKHPSEAVYFVNAGKAKIHLPDGKTVEKEIAAGEIMWHDAWSHRIENIGKTDIVAVIVEVK